MGSVGNQSPWAPYDTSYKDCSQGICSIYCPQWCYIIFPPPPPSTLIGGDDLAGTTDISPIIIAIIGILASAFILVGYYTLISKYCRRRNRTDTALELNENHNQATNEAWQGATPGLDGTVIKSITVCKYAKGDGLIEGTDCSVCLSEFQENESLRLLPKCNHAFHLPCIDKWLKSHASCPLCRANVVAGNNHLLPQAPLAPPSQETPQNATTVITTVSTLDQYQHRIHEAVPVIQDLESGFREESIINLVVGDEVLKNSSDHEGLDCVSIRRDQVLPIRRSALLSCSSSSQVPVSVADMLRISEDDEDDEQQLSRGGEKSRSGILSGLVRNPLAMKRSISTGRLMMSTTPRHEKGSWSTVIPFPG